MFLPDISKHLCPDCAPAHARIEAECAAMADPVSVLAEAKSRQRGLKRHRDQEPPSSFRELLPWLLQHPHVRVTGPTAFGEEPTTRDEAFVAFRTGLLWFKGVDGLNHIPISFYFERTENVEKAQTPISFDTTGFTVFRFGAHIRVEYQP